MIKGTLALVIRYVLYLIGGALAGIGAATMSMDGGDLCLNIRHVADATAHGLVLLISGGATFGVSAIWSRIVKRKGGVT